MASGTQPNEFRIISETKTINVGTVPVKDIAHGVIELTYPTGYSAFAIIPVNSSNLTLFHSLSFVPVDTTQINVDVGLYNPTDVQKTNTVATVRVLWTKG